VLGKSLLRRPALHDETTLGLIKRLMNELAILLRQEVALASVEITGALSKLVAGVLSIALGGTVLLAGFMVLLVSAVLGLANVVAPWLAALIVGGVVFLVGVVLVVAGSRALDPSILKPRRSPESLRKDKAVLSRSTS
jgi:hypothetical protein